MSNDNKPAAAQEAVATVDIWTNGSYWPNYKLTWHKDVEAGTQLFAAPVAAAPAEPDLDAHDPASGELAAQWLYGNGLKELAFVVRTQLDMRGARIRELSASTPAAPGIDLEQVRVALTDVYVALSCINAGDDGSVDLAADGLVRLREAIALIDASPKGGSDAQAVLDALVSLVAVARRYLPDYDEHPEVQKADAAIDAAKQAASAEVGATPTDWNEAEIMSRASRLKEQEQ